MVEFIPMRTGPAVTIVIFLVILISGYFGYEYVKNTPPDFLIELFAKPKPAPPLPAGDIAPWTAPSGFTATIFSRDVPGARVMTRDPKGAMLVSLTQSGKIVALTDTNTDGKAELPITVLEGLRRPHGILVNCPYTGNESADQDACKLYVAETDSLKEYSYDADTFTAKLLRILTTFPSGGGHFTRTIQMHPDGKRLLVSVGSSCNVCNERDAKRATVVAYDLTTDKESIFATGLRNTVFMAIHPVTGDIWGTDNGRDLIGDDIPPDELNIIEEGKNYGWPVCYGKNVYDTDYDGRPTEQCAGLEPSHVDLQAHSAALGLVFVPEEGWPEDMWHDALVAYHGSWNRSVPTGYKVVRINLDDRGNPRASDPTDFLTGFLAPDADEGEARGRPAGLLIEPGGSVYVSDDHAGAIYKVSWLRE